jgi:hypothetical protein
VESDGFEVLTGSLTDGAAEYMSAHQLLAQTVAQFRSASEVPDSAWGRLPDAGTMALEYKKFRNDIIAQLAKLNDGLLTGAVNLTAIEALYKAADAAVAELTRSMLTTGFSQAQVAAAEKLDSQEGTG